jgi:hypothetical protein
MLTDLASVVMDSVLCEQGARCLYRFKYTLLLQRFKGPFFEQFVKIFVVILFINYRKITAYKQ